MSKHCPPKWNKSFKIAQKHLATLRFIFTAEDHRLSHMTSSFCRSYYRCYYFFRWNETPMPDRGRPCTWTVADHSLLSWEFLETSQNVSDRRTCKPSSVLCSPWSRRNSLRWWGRVRLGGRKNDSPSPQRWWWFAESSEIGVRSSVKSSNENAMSYLCGCLQ